MSPSRVVRVYLPLDGTELRRLADCGVLGAPLVAFAVTARLQRAAPEADLEEAEYAALLAAAAEAADRRGLALTRRVVGAADLPWAAVAEPQAPLEVALAQVRVVEPVLRRHLVSFHLDELPGGLSDPDLMWYDATELEAVIRLATG